MYYSEERKEYKKAGFINESAKRGTATKEEVKEKFGKYFTEKPKRSKFEMVNGVPHKRVNGKLVPLTRVEK